MTKFIRVLVLLACTGYLSLKGQTLSKETIVLETDLGTIKLKLYEETPLHKANFLKLVNQGLYDSLLFHRVINGFMIQGGDPKSKTAKESDTLGNGEIGYTIPAEINEKLIHKKGTLCAAREGDDINPKFESSACQFYLVQGKVRSPEELKKYEDRINKTKFNNAARAVMKSEQGKLLKTQYDKLKLENKTDSAAIINSELEALIKTENSKKPEYKFSEFQQKTYTSIGGTPHLDGTYTVFGEVIEGIEIIDKIAAVKTNSLDRPIKNVRMKMKV
ncbi:MAG: peptidylprolyl isomerase, partial [Bacteroidia bacterium]|nr:peptidylprolyl isomerase [Bacteroidia bacterium]